MSVRDGFTLSAVGDCIVSRPLSHYAERDEAVASALKLLQESDATYGNLETNIIEMREFKGYPYSWDGDWTLASDPAVAKDLPRMGFDLFSRANNHAMDWGLEGMRETSRFLNENGLTYAGTGESAGIARSAQYFESSKGRIGLVSMASTYRPTSNALPARGASPGRPGISGLSLRKITVVTQDVMNSLQGIRKTMGKKGAAKEQNGEKLSLFDQEFEVGSSFRYRYEMNSDDLAAILKGIRQGKQNSDFLIASIHSHEPLNAEFFEEPAEFLRELAHATINAGADAFFTTGIHHIGPIEIYRGRPIFYGLANFFWSDMYESLPSDLYLRNQTRLSKAFKYPEKATDSDLTALLNVPSFANDLTFQTFIAQSRFERGAVSEIRLYPVDLGYGRILTESGIPRIASPEKAQEILRRVQTISKPYGTNIVIENNIGIVRVTPGG